jgi:hypothetical protein
MDILSRLVDSKLAVEKETTRCKIRLSHLKLQNRTCEDTAKIMQLLLPVEDYIDGRIEAIIKEHPAYPWFSLVKGVGPESIAKCIGSIRIKPEKGYRKNKETKKVELVDLPFASTISGVWAFSGFGLDDDHKAMKPKEGEPLSYNSELRSMWWRLGSSILKAGLRQKCSKCGKLIGQEAIEKHPCEGAEFTTVGTTKFASYYLREKAKDIQQHLNKGWKIVPATELPKDQAGKRREKEGIISEGHIHNRALRKMIKLFQGCLVLIWREAEGLPPTKPYAIDKLGHDSMIDPWEMVDR